MIDVLSVLLILAFLGICILLGILIIKLMKPKKIPSTADISNVQKEN